jgi:hypothetical protein
MVNEKGPVRLAGGTHVPSALKGKVEIVIERVDSLLVQHFYVRFPIGAVTAASDGFESAAVQDLDFTALIFYQPATLQFAGRSGDADAAGAAESYGLAPSLHR